MWLNFLPHPLSVRLLSYKAMKMSLINSELLVRFFENKTSSEENNAIADWIESDSSNQETFNRALQSHLMLMNLSASEMASAAPVRRKRLSVYVSSAAALLAGVFLTWFAAVVPMRKDTSGMLTFQTEAGQQATVTLPDGTSVQLNSCSELRYPAVFSRKERRVEISGEAMFDVTKDAGRPFVVETFAYDVKVLGTKFNVIADKEYGEFSTALIEGSVALFDKNDEKITELKPDQMAVLSGDTLVKTMYDNIANRYRWTDGIIDCGGLSFEEIMRKFEKSFGVNVIIECEKIPDVTYKRMKVNVHDGISHAFALLQRTTDFAVEYDDATYTYYIR